MWRYILLAITVALSACATVSPQQTYTAAVRSSVLIETEGGSGSGVILNDKCALTAKHVVDGAKEIKITNWQAKEYPVITVTLSEFSDIAVICSSEWLGEKSVRIRKQMPELYTPLFAVGNPLGIRDVVTTGLYQGDEKMTAPIAWGNSGGGVFDESGAVIGIAVSVAIRRIEQYVFVFPHLGNMETSRNIVQFLDENRIPYHSSE